MKYSQLIGIVAVLALIANCFIPWVYIASVHITVNGLHAEGTDFGKPGLLAIIFGAVCIVFFMVHKIWAKRTNVFIGAILFAWSIKNYIIITACSYGDCPEKKAGIFLQLVISFIVLLMTFFPKIELPEEDVK